MGWKCQWYCADCGNLEIRPFTRASNELRNPINKPWGKVRFYILIPHRNRGFTVVGFVKDINIKKALITLNCHIHAKCKKISSSTRERDKNMVLNLLRHHHHDKYIYLCVSYSI